MSIPEQMCGNKNFEEFEKIAWFFTKNQPENFD